MANQSGKVIAVCTSDRKGIPKKNVGEGVLVPKFGLENDAHGGDWHRQVSLLAMESIEKMQKLGLKVKPGSFAENITTEGLSLVDIPIGTRFKIGSDAIMELTQIGKECHTKCAIYDQAGDCVMPKEGVFAIVIQGGAIREGDLIEVLAND